MKNPIKLELTASGIDHYCRELAKTTATLEKRVAAIDALITFVSSQTHTGEQIKPEFIAIKRTLLDHFDQAREALLVERALRLQQALQCRQLAHLSALFVSSSRDAFWALLGRVEQQFDATDLNAIRVWAFHWMSDAKRRAQQASVYPDAIDLKAAEIDISEFLAMTDLCRYFGIEA